MLMNKICVLGGHHVVSHKGLRRISLAASLLFATLLLPTSAPAAPLPLQAIFRGPGGMVLSDGHLWIVDNLASDVVELSSSGTSLLKVINAPANCFNAPNDIASSGRYLWVTSTNCVAQLNASNGSIVQILTEAK